MIKKDNTQTFYPGQTADAVPVLIFPDPVNIFLNRSRRFDSLAEGHSLSEWLSFLGRLTLTQHRLLQTYPFFPLPEADELSFTRKHCLPPVPAQSWRRDSLWRQILNSLADDLETDAPPVVQNTLQKLLAMEDDDIEGIAEQILCGEPGGNQTDLFPFVAAALQVYWTALAAGLGKELVAPLNILGACPCCGFLPVASLVRTDGEVTGLRYLHCALCNTQWNMVRVTCTTCNDNQNIGYQHIEGSDEAVKAETCDACKSYLKILYQQKSPAVDPVADDLATLALDMLVDDAGYNRSGPNLLFIPGTASR